MNWLENTTTTTVDPRDIDLGDERYLIPCFDDPDPLVRSVKRVGILNPPLLQESADGRVVPVLGRRRIEVAVRLGIREVHCRVARAAMPETDAFELAFWDNCGHRTLDRAGVALVVRRLMELFPVATVAELFLPVLGVPPKGPRLEMLRAVGGLERPILEAFATGRLNEKTAALLTRLTGEERMLLVDLTGKLGLNANKAAEIITYLVDLSVYRQITVESLLADRAAQDILGDVEIGLPEKADRFRDLVRSWKFPDLTRQRAALEAWLKSAEIPEHVTLLPEQSFEGETCTVSVKCPSRETAEAVLSRIVEPQP